MVVALLLARLTAGAFAGACLYIALVQVPVRRDLGVAAALDDFRRTIPYAERVQAPLLVASILATAAVALLGFRPSILVGGLVLVAVLVLTIAAVLPINRRLLSGQPGDHLVEARSALSRWALLHALRTGVAVLGAALLLL